MRGVSREHAQRREQFVCGSCRPGTLSIQHTEGCICVSLADLGVRSLHLEFVFADNREWIKSTYSTKTTSGAIVLKTMTTKELLNVRDTARLLGVHENTVRNWEARGLLRAVRLPGSGFRRFAPHDVERLRAEMFEQLAPATEGPVVNAGRKRSGRLVFGDATE
jgi:hypothetical protein